MPPKKPRYTGESMTITSPFADLAAKLNPTQSTPDPTTSQPPAAAVAPINSPPAAPKAPALPKVKSTRIERAHRGGKTVTVVSFHNAPTEAALNAWLNMAKKTLGIGGSIEGENVVLQGDQTKRIDRCR